MIKQCPSKIIKSGFREVLEGPLHLCYDTYRKKHDASHGSSENGKLHFVKDEILFVNGRRTSTCEEKLWVILLPLSGALAITQNQGQAEIILPNEFKLLQTHKGDVLNLTNPNNASEINYLYIGIQPQFFPAGFLLAAQKIVFTKKNELCDMHLDSLTGRLFWAGIGVYEGRKESVYKLKAPGNAVYVFVVNGAFEVEGRLLEHHDSLLLWDTGDVEFEALATNSVLLLLET